MRGSARRQLPARQRGIALLALMALFSVVVLFAFISGLNRSAASLAQTRALATTNALAQAKEALIAYAVTYKDTHDNPGSNSYTVPGYLPCPDIGSSASEGETASICPGSLVSFMGRLPWKTLGLDALKDGSGECLWYAVSGTYKYNPNGVTTNNTTSTYNPNNMMNWDTNGQFAVFDSNGNTLAGSTEDNRAVAVIFAPGAALSGQDRTPAAGTTNCGGNYNPAAYMESAKDINNNIINNSTLVTPTSPGSVTDVSSFIAGTGSDTFNDKLVYITRADIWNAIKKRSDFNNYLRSLTRRAAECFVSYGMQNGNGFPNDRRLPWASNWTLPSPSLPLSPTANYAVDRRYQDNSSYLSGRLPYRVNNSAQRTPINALPSNVSDLGKSDYYLPTFGGCGYTNDQKIWYDNWKDQLFYAVASNYIPSAANSPMAACPTCLTINGGGSYAAVVIFAGDKRTDPTGQVIQPRNTATDKGAVANYLDGSNPASIVANTGGGNYQAAATSSAFNDIVYAIDTNLAVSCSDANGAMRPLTLGTPPPGPPGDLAAYAACP